MNANVSSTSTIDSGIEVRASVTAAHDAKEAYRLSLVIPVFNEQESLSELIDAISSALCDSKHPFEVVFVDDGSDDRSWKEIETLASAHGHVRGIKLRRNFGKAAALDAGFRYVDGDIVLTLDADLQDDPKEIHRFLAKLEEGYDVVSGWKQVRHDPWHKVLPSRVFNRLVSKLTGVQLHDHNCGFKAYRREVLSDIRLYGERHRFVPVLAAEQGWRVAEIIVEHHARPYGQSKYGVSRILKGFLDLLSIYLLTAFGKRPLHLIGTGGVLCFFLGGLGLLYLTTRWCLSRLIESWTVLHLHESAMFYYCILAILLGSQFMLAGLLAEFLVSMQARNSPGANIEKEIGFEKA